MIDSPGNHSPTPEFTAFLARDIARTLRHGARFAPSAHRNRARRAGLGLASAAVTVTALVIGLVFGNSTGYASARVEGVQRRDQAAANALDVMSQIAVLRGNLARTRSELERRATQAGSVSRASLRAAESELASMEESAARIEIDLTQNEVALAPLPARSIPMKRAFSLACVALALAAPAPPPQQGIPIVVLPAAATRTTTTLGLIAGISGIFGGLNEVAGGKVLVNDPGHRQLRLFDTTLAASTIVADSAPGFSNSYGPVPVPLIPYRGDSSIVPDFGAQTLLVLDQDGQVARALALPDPREFGNFVVGYTGVDHQGRLLYRGNPGLRLPSPDDPPRSTVGDSIPILRADLGARRVDTVGRIKVREGGWQTTDRSDPMRPRISQELNPLPVLDDWAVLSDGSVAFVRGHDYHIDWIRPDGTRESTPKMPFDWKRLTDGDKQRIIDSARSAQATQAATAAARRGALGVDAGSGAVPGRGRSGGGAVDSSGRGAAPIQVTFVPPSKMTDFYPPIRRGALKSDRDGNLWILPTTSAQSQGGELVYDVVNLKGELYKRVRLPAGRSIAGFAKGGVIYLISGDRASGFYLERTRLSAQK